MKQRVAFFGTPSVAVPALMALCEADDLDVVAVVTNPDRPRGRRGSPLAPPVKVAATELDVEILQPDDPSMIVNDLVAMDLNVGVVVAYGKILAPAVLATARQGFINLHFSLLPRWRGAAPVQHALRAGDLITGATTFLLDEGMDTGPMLGSLTTPISEEDDAGTLLDRLAVDGADLLIDAVRMIGQGFKPVAQPSDGVTYAPKISRDDLRIDWHDDADAIARLVRSASPRPGAQAELNGQPIKVLRARTATQHHAREPSEPCPAVGTVLAVHDGDAVVQTGAGVLAVSQVQPAGRRRMSAQDLANGMGGLVGELFT